MDCEENIRNIIAYHSPCFDGDMAAAIGREVLPKCTFFGWKHELQEENINNIKEIIKDSSKKVNIYFLDVCPKFEFILDIKDIVNSVVIIDHHKSACEKFIFDKNNYYDQFSWKGMGEFFSWTWHQLKSILSDWFDWGIEDYNPNKYPLFFFDNSRSGCQLTFDYFRDRYPIKYPIGVYPKPVKWVGDKDIWKWDDENTEPFTAAFHKYFELSAELTTKERLNIYKKIINSDEQVHTEVIDLGKHIINVYRQECLTFLPLIKLTKDTDKNGKELSIVQLPMTKYYLNKYILELVQEKYPTYNVLKLTSEKENKISVSLRSLQDDVRVDLLAQKYGGNGHYKASGYSVNI